MSPVRIPFSSTPGVRMPFSGSSSNPLENIIKTGLAIGAFLFFTGCHFRNCWSRFFCPNGNGNDEEQWDSHGLPANIIVSLKKLNRFKKYKLSDIVLFDNWHGGTDNSFFEVVSLSPEGIYTKTQLLKELETLATCGMFKKVDLKGKTNPDGTIGITISFLENTWESPNEFRCINVGPQAKTACLLPTLVKTEMLELLRDEGNFSARMLKKIKDKVQQWYHDNGYACAQVVNFANVGTNEVVCEVVEGDITQLVILFQDELGTKFERNDTEILHVVRKKLPEQLCQGGVFNIDVGKQALRNINSLKLFSNIEINPRHDEKNEGGIIVEIKLSIYTE